MFIICCIMIYKECHVILVSRKSLTQFKKKIFWKRQLVVKTQMLQTMTVLEKERNIFDGSPSSGEVSSFRKVFPGKEML